MTEQTSLLDKNPVQDQSPDLTGVFKSADAALREATQDSRFTPQVPETDEDSYWEGYWEKLNQFMQGRIEAHRKSTSALGTRALEQMIRLGVDSPPEHERRRPLTAHVLGLLAATPDFIYANAVLSPDSGRNHDEKVQARAKINRFSGMIADMAREHPDVHADELRDGLTDFAIGNLDDDLADIAGMRIQGAVRRAQHVHAYGQLLEAAGRRHVPATPEEQGNGTNYLVVGSRGQILEVEVRHTATKIESRGVYNKAHEGARGHIVTLSMVSNSDLGNRFTIPEELVRERVEQVDEQLKEAELNQSDSALAYSA